MTTATAKRRRQEAVGKQVTEALAAAATIADAFGDSKELRRVFWAYLGHVCLAKCHRDPHRQSDFQRAKGLLSILASQTPNGLAEAALKLLGSPDPSTLDEIQADVAGYVAHSQKVAAMKAKGAAAFDKRADAAIDAMEAAGAPQ